MVSTRTSVGSIGILANHSRCWRCSTRPSCGSTSSESEVIRFAQGEGFLQMTGDRALVLVDEVFSVDKLTPPTCRTPPAGRGRAGERRGGHGGAPRRRARQAPLRAFLKLAESRSASRLRTLRKPALRRAFFLPAAAAGRAGTKKPPWRRALLKRGVRFDYGVVVEIVKVSVLV